MKTTNADTNIWGIPTTFIKKNCIALGWAKMGDLAALKPDREALKARVAEVYPDRKPGAIPVDAGKLFRFVHEIKPSDLVAYRAERGRQIHPGRVQGDCG